MKFLKKLILKKGLKNFGKAILKVADNTILGGVIHKTTSESNDSPKGKVPYLELISALIPVILLIALLFGIITIEQLKELIKIF